MTRSNEVPPLVLQRLGAQWDPDDQILTLWPEGAEDGWRIRKADLRKLLAWLREHQLDAG